MATHGGPAATHVTSAAATRRDHGGSALVMREPLRVGQPVAAAVGRDCVGARSRIRRLARAACFALTAGRLPFLGRTAARDGRRAGAHSGVPARVRAR